VSEALYERYKDALRRGHIAALRGRPEEALSAYRQAIEIAPERAMPYVSLGGVLARLGRHDEALEAFDLAIERTPEDEIALRGRADALVAANRRTEAAETLDRLSGLFDGQGRLADACDAAREALELAESRDRRQELETFARRLRSEGRDVASTAALGRALEVLGDPGSKPRVIRVSGGPVGDGASVADGASVGDWPGAAAPVVSSPVTSAPVPRQVDLLAAVERALDAGDVDAVRASTLAAAAAQRGAGLLEAALDTCYMALATIPADPDIHLALAGLYLDRGWRVSAVDKIILLGRLADLAGDDATHDRLAALVAERLPDEPRLAARYG
jgi:tetratricopeptide (TPR) repeat protein